MLVKESKEAARRWVLEQGHRTPGFAEHARVLDAIRKGDGEAAGAAMEAHVERVKLDVLRVRFGG